MSASLSRPANRFLAAGLLCLLTAVATGCNATLHHALSTEDDAVVNLPSTYAVAPGRHVRTNVGDPTPVERHAGRHAI